MDKKLTLAQRANLTDPLSIDAGLDSLSTRLRTNSLDVELVKIAAELGHPVACELLGVAINPELTIDKAAESLTSKERVAVACDFALRIYEMWEKEFPDHRHKTVLKDHIHKIRGYPDTPYEGSLDKSRKNLTLFSEMNSFSEDAFLPSIKQRKTAFMPQAISFELCARFIDRLYGLVEHESGNSRKNLKDLTDLDQAYLVYSSVVTLDKFSGYCLSEVEARLPKFMDIADSILPECLMSEEDDWINTATFEWLEHSGAPRYMAKESLMILDQETLWQRQRLSKYILKEV